MTDEEPRVSGLFRHQRKERPSPRPVPPPAAEDVREMTHADFAAKLGLPPGTTVTSIGLVWFDRLSGSENNTVRVHYRPDPKVRPLLPVPEGQQPLEDRLRRLAVKWRSQARHPMRQTTERATERTMLNKHADELTEELRGTP